MKSHTTGFKNAVKELGRQLRVVITYGNVTLEEEIYAVTPRFEGGILKSIMKQLDLELSVDIPLETVLNCQIGILVNGSYEMLNYGNYVVYKSEKQEDTNTYKLTCYDKMLYSMKQNEDLGIPYPISIKNYLIAICNKLGLTLKTTTFQNESRMIQNELYLGLDYTYRDILDEIAQATGSIICLNENDEVIVKYPTQTNDTIDEEFLKDVNVDFGQMYGAINTIVLSRSGESDNIYYPPELPENPIEIKIKDNQIMNWNDRSDYLPGIYNALNGLYYYINDFSSTGIMYYEVGDLYNVQVGNNTYQCLMLNDEINITTGIEEIIHTDLPEQSETDYTKADKTDRRINQTYLIVDKQNQQIESLITTQTDQNQKIARVTQTVDGISTRVSSTETSVRTLQTDVQTAQSTANSAQSTANSAQSTANTATTKANNAQTSANNAQATADSINTNLTTNYYTKTQTNSAINQKADSITSTVSQTYSTKTETTAAKNAAINSANASTDTKLQSYSTTTQMNTAIEQKANQITSTVSKTYSTKAETSNAIDNIKIGGANLLRFTQSGENWTKTSFDARELTFTIATTATTEAFITHPKNYLTLEKNTQYTLSAWIKSNGYVKSVDFYCYDKNTDHPQSKLNISVNTTWQFVSWTFTTNNYSNSDYSQTTVRFDNNGSTTQGTNAILYVKKPKLEIGNKATDWQPSSEDYSTTTEMNSAITQKANEISARIDQIEDVTNEANGTKTVTLTNCVKGSVLELHIYGNNSVFQAMYPNNTLYPQNNLYPKGDSLITVKYANNTTKTYELGVTEVLRKNGSVYDEYVLESGQAKVIRRINSNGTVKTNPTTQNLGEYSIALEEGTNTITIKNYSADMYVKYAIKSAYTDIFATQVQMNSSITQTAQEINLEVSKKVDSNEVISKINQSAEAVGISANKINLSANDVLNLLAGNTINLSSKNIEIKADDILINNHGMSFTYNGNKVGNFVTEEITGDSSKRGVSMNIDSNAYFLGLGKYDSNNESQQILAFYNRPTSSHDNAIQIGNSNWNTFVTIHEDAYVYGYLSAANLINRSLENLKKDIEKSEINATEEVMNTDIYSYRLKEEKEDDKKHIGVIIGEKYKCSDKILNQEKDGVELYSMTSILWKAFQEQQEEIEKLRKEIEK